MPFTKYLMCAHTQVQLDLFLRNNDIDPARVKRITDLGTLAGRAACPLYLLPDWHLTTRCAEKIRIYWPEQGGRLVSVLDDQVMGRTRFVFQPQDF